MKTKLLNVGYKKTAQLVMSRSMHQNPWQHGIDELHRMFNQNCAPYTWLSFHSSPDSLRWQLLRNENLTLLSSLTDFNNHTTSLFSSETYKAMMLVCEWRLGPEKGESYKNSKVANISITSSTFEGMTELILILESEENNIEEWLLEQR